MYLPADDVLARSSAAPSVRRSPAARLVVCATAAFALAAIVFFLWRMAGGAYTPDFPWLLRAGQWMLDQRMLPSGDLFSWTHAGEPWVLYQWLFEVMIAGGERLLGMPGLLALFNLAAVGLYLVLPVLGVVPRRVPLVLTTAICSVALAVVTVNLSLRPMLITCAGLLLQYWLVQRVRRGEMRLWAAALLLAAAYLLWANMHTGVVLGIVSLLLAALGDAIERSGLYRFAPADASIEGRPLKLGGYGLLMAAAFLASLINPYGLGIYRYIAELSSDSYLNSVIDELRPLTLSITQHQWFLLLVGTTALLALRARRVLAPGDVLHLLALTACTLVSVRFIVWAALFYALILPRAAHQWLQASAAGGDAERLLREPGERRLRRALVAFAVVAPLAFGALGVGATRPNPCTPLQPGLQAYLAARSDAARPFSDAVIGSCALAIDGSATVFIDTRFDFYGSRFVREYLETLTLQPGWQTRLEKWRIDLLAVERGWPLADRLLADPAFQVLHRDEAMVVAHRR